MSQTGTTFSHRLHGHRAVSRTQPASDSIAGSLLVVLPAVYLATLVGPFSGVAWNPVEYAVIGVSFYIASVALAAVDERSLYALGVDRPASAYWALLTPMPYLVARTRALIDEERQGLASLWIAIAATTLTASWLGLLAFG